MEMKQNDDWILFERENHYRNDTDYLKRYKRKKLVSILAWSAFGLDALLILSLLCYTFWQTMFKLIGG